MIFWNLLKTPDKHNKTTGKFSDVQDGLWYSQAVNYLAEMGIILGFGDETFRPEQKITRAEFTAIAAWFDDSEKDLISLFTDIPETHWACSAITATHAKGWINGNPGGEFEPDASITRGEAVSTVNRMIGRAPVQETIPEEFNNLYSDMPYIHWAFAEIMEASVSSSA
jgi:hypothetical protein